MKTKILFITMIAAAIAIAGCNKENNDDNGEDANTPSVHMAGVEYDGQPYDRDGTTRHKGVAKVWKDGKLLYTLTDGKNDAYAGQIFIAGNDIYVAGAEANARGHFVAKVWKNGKLLYTLTDGTNDAVIGQIFVVGNDVYVAGKEEEEEQNEYGYTSSYFAKVWKNGSSMFTDGTNNNWLYSIFVAGNDVYVTGADKVWKNGELLYTLTNGTSIYVFISGNDVYVAGAESNESHNFVAKVWRNGNVLYTLSDGTSTYMAFPVYVVGNDVYAVSYYAKSDDMYENIDTKVWKNGEPLYMFTNHHISGLLVK
jgi:hypothetical protein